MVIVYLFKKIYFICPKSGEILWQHPNMKHILYKKYPKWGIAAN